MLSYSSDTVWALVMPAGEGTAPFDRSNVIVLAEVEIATEVAMKMPGRHPLDGQTINDEGGQQIHYERFCRVGA